MNASDIMTKKIVAVAPKTTVRDAIRVMLENAVSAVLVVDEAQKLVGIITAGDLLRRSELGTERRLAGFDVVKRGPDRCAEDFIRAHSQTIEDLMTRDPVTVGESAPLADIVNLMERHQVQRLPVVKQGAAIGIVGRRDILRALLESRQAGDAGENTDDAIHDRLLSLYALESWAPLACFDVSVENGIVDLHGEVDSDVKRRALIVAAKGIPGVMDVRDRLTLRRKTGMSAPRGV